MQLNLMLQKKLDSPKHCHNLNKEVLPLSNYGRSVVPIKDADGMANSEEPDLTGRPS